MLFQIYVGDRSSAAAQSMITPYRTMPFSQATSDPQYAASFAIPLDDAHSAYGYNASDVNDTGAHIQPADKAPRRTVYVDDTSNPNVPQSNATFKVLYGYTADNSAPPGSNPNGIWYGYNAGEPLSAVSLATMQQVPSQYNHIESTSRQVIYAIPTEEQASKSLSTKKNAYNALRVDASSS